MNPIILYDNKLLTATLSNSTLASGYNVQNVKDYRAHTFAKFNAAGTNYIQGVWGSAVSINGVGICGHNFNTVGATVSVEHSEDGNTWTEAAASTPANNNTIVYSFTVVTKRYWRLKVVNSSGQPYIGVLFFSYALAFQYPSDTPCEPYSEKIVGEDSESETGNLLGASVKYTSVEVNHTWSTQNLSWVDNYFRLFWDNHAKLLKPFFYAWDLTNAPGEMFYLRVKKEMVLSTPRSNLIAYDNITLNMIGRR